MKKCFAYGLLTIVLLGMAGCSNGKKDSQTIDNQVIKENTTILKSDGTIQSVLVESFEKDYYKKNELNSYIDEAIQNYTKKSGKDTVVLDSLDVDNKVATARFSYKNMTDFAAFNAIETELLTKEQALKDERISGTVYSVEKGDTVDLETALKDKDYKIVVANLPNENIMTEGKVAYYTNGTMSGDNVIKAGSEGVTVIIYE